MPEGTMQLRGRDRILLGDQERGQLRRDSSDLERLGHLIALTNPMNAQIET